MFPRKHTILGKELINRWNINVHELSYLILKHGITVLDSSTLPKIKFLFNPHDYRIDFAKVLNILRNDSTGADKMLFWLPELEKLAIEKEISLLKSKSTPKPHFLWPHMPPTEVGDSRWRLEETRFRGGEPEKHEGATPESVKTVRNVIEDQEEKIRQNSNVFSLIGKVWFIKFKQQEWGLFADHQKYKYIAIVLNLPNIGYTTGDLEFSIYNTELVGKVKGLEITEEYQGDKTQEALVELNESRLSETLTSEEVKRLKEIGYELLEQLREAKDADNQELVDDAKMKIVNYRSYLYNEYGIKAAISEDETKIHFKIQYRSSKESEKIRQLIKNQIKNAIKDFHDSLPMLRMHLDRSLKTKAYKTFYLPETHISWHISM